MMLKETLRQVVKSQRADLSLLEYGVERESLKQIDLNLPYALVLSGVRRCGKSTLLRQLMEKVGECYYFNFEDTRAAGFEVEDFPKLNDIFFEEYGECSHYFFDEIQNVQKWERFVRNMLDRKKRFVITGSNASLLSRELGTKLTGRHLRHELFPFSFREMLLLKKRKPGFSSFEEYLKRGGFPEYLKYDRADILRELLEDIVIRDIVARHKLRNPKIVKEMALYLLTNIGREFSYNNLKKTFSLGSTNSAIAFVSYFEDSYLLFTVPKFDYSLKKQLVNPKKVYSIDNGLSSINSVSFSSDRGKMLENAVFLHLRRRCREIFYFREKNECDFLVRENGRISSAIQVCYELHEENKERELGGLLEALRKFGLRDGLILTYNQEDEFKLEGRRVVVKPVWRWMLE